MAANANVRSDLATERVMFIDATRKDARGDKILKVLPWQYVVIDGVGGFEPVDYSPVAATGGLDFFNKNEKQIRSIQFINEDAFLRLNGVGGNVGLPTG